MVIAVIYQIAMIGIYIGGYKYTADRPEKTRSSTSIKTVIKAKLLSNQ